MSIVMIRVNDERVAEEPDPAASAAAIPESVVRALTQSATRAGQRFVVYDCANEDDAVERLRGARGEQADIVLFDPGCRAPGADRVGETLSRMSVPYVEVHDDRFGAIEPVLADGKGRRVGLVHGYASQSYTLAMWLALDTIGCAESANDIHVGT